MDGQFLKQAFELAGAVGQFQGKIEFITQHPDHFTHQELINELVRLSFDINKKLEAVG